MDFALRKITVAQNCLLINLKNGQIDNMFSEIIWYGTSYHIADESMYCNTANTVHKKGKVHPCLVVSLL